MHDLHVWQIDASRVLCTAHISVPQGSDVRQVLHCVHTLLHANGLHASTIQPELVPAVPPVLATAGVDTDAALVAASLQYMCSDMLCADVKCIDKGCCHVPAH